MQKRNKTHKKVPIPYLTALVAKLAPKIGAKVVVEPEWGIAAQIIYNNGVVRSLRMYSLDLNHIASSDIARDQESRCWGVPGMEREGTCECT